MALDANTGDELWSADVDVSDYDDNGYNRAMDGPRSTPTVDGNVGLLDGSVSWKNMNRMLPYRSSHLWDTVGVW